MSFDPRLICQALNDEGVLYVVVGGLAAVVHGSPLPTSDVDVVPERSRLNLERLARALQRVGARLRTEAGPIEVPIDADFLRSMSLVVNLTTDHGDVDLVFEPAGPRQSFSDWNVTATDVDLAEGLVVRIASLDDIISSKRAAGRSKDLGALPYLESLRDELRSQD